MKKLYTLIAILVCMAMLAACATPTPQTVYVTQEVKVVETQEVKVIETKEVVKEVEKVKEVTAAAPTVELWNKDDVTKATGTEACKPLATLPKKLKQPWNLGFIMGNTSHPFFQALHKGIQDAAKFYGVEATMVDAGTSPQGDMLATVLDANVNVVGSMGDVDAIGARTQELGIPFINVDFGRTDYSPYVYGIPTTIAGTNGGKLLVEGMKKRLESDWKDKEVFFAELTHGGIPSCVQRTGAATNTVKAGLSLDDKHVIKMDVAVTAVEDQVKAFLTAHPKAVMGMIPCWDGLGISPLNNAVEMGRGNDVMLVTLGGDQPTLAYLASKPQGYYGLLEFQPYCEGWGWTETALAVVEGLPFQAYVTDRTVTADTAEARYQALYGALPTPTPKQ